jgi:L,D-peptidoglycan transpeptidase YkuD (ErfK/YbiS/YcfS/YnhG family)
MRIDVDARNLILRYDGHAVPCVIGKAGTCASEDKREGDGRTPLGTWRIRAALLRPDKGLTPPRNLPWRWIRPSDGWSDTPADPAYNRPVRHPHAFSAERLWRSDDLYDAILLLDHNDDPPVPGLGSAIFVHLREGPFTEGCVAVPRETMRDLLGRLTADSTLAIL